MQYLLDWIYKDVYIHWKNPPEGIKKVAIQDTITV